MVLLVFYIVCHVNMIILYLCHDMKLGQRNKVLQIRVLGVLSLFLRVCFFPGFCALIPPVSLLPSLSFEGHRDVPSYRDRVSSDIMSKIPVHHTLEWSQWLPGRCVYGGGLSLPSSSLRSSEP